MVEDKKLKTLILDYLSNNRVMAIATSNKNIPWVASVMFAYDDNLNLYFISEPATRKIKNLKANPKVAIAINEFKKIPGKTIGIQLEGRVIMLDKKKDFDKLKIFEKRFAWADDFLDTHELFKIKPSKIIYLDDELFGSQGKRELKL